MRRIAPLLLLISILPNRASPQDLPTVPEPGVSAALAAQRARDITDLQYDLWFRIPTDPDSAINGAATVRFQLGDASSPLVLDFDPPAPRVLAVSRSGQPVPYELHNGHIVVPATALRRGEDELDFRFIAGDGSLNRNADFLYTLFVPDRASNAFPSFDQPDLKGVYRLTLEIPADWQAVANGAEEEVTREGEYKRIRFAATQPLSTYLFSFAAGKFQIETAERDGRVLRMFHRETERDKVAHNRDIIFDLHAAALSWLEDYTGISYPFGKLDFVLVPAFQYGGMEHPGAILYNAGRLLLETTATQNELLGRASLIAHETSHMWFGDLVTMRWFNDVWMKEVFANFMAAKIVNPSFPEIDHELRFLLAHHPAAYAVDRTAGTHAIRQQLENLNEAGSLYGAIIYQKAPVVMRQLEAIIGVQPFRDGLREYLRKFSYGNATWQDLVRILDRRAPEDLAAWSRVWVEEAGRPQIHAQLEPHDGRIRALTLHQSDPAEAGRVWPQRVDVWLGSRGSGQGLPVVIDEPEVRVPAAEGLPLPSYVLPDARGLGYGEFVLDALTRRFLLDSLSALPAALTRGTATLALWDAMFAGDLPAAALLETLLGAASSESEQLLTERHLGTIPDLFWRFLRPEERLRVGPAVERTLWAGLASAPTASAKASWLAALREVALTDPTISRLYALWARTDSVPGMPLVERDYTALAHALALRDLPSSAAILEQQLARIENPDRRARFTFTMPAFSLDPAKRDSFFSSLAEVRNRAHEPWVLEGLSALNHPLRARAAEKYIRPGLELLPEVQRTGDIFFPRRWVDALLSGHASPSAAAIVRRYLDEHPELAPRLRAVVLQAADELFRAAKAAREVLLDPAHPEWSKHAPPVSRIRFETSRGAFVAEVMRGWAPLGADRFYNLARLGFYDDTRFHRVNANYIAQFGLSGDPAITAAWRTHTLPDDPPRSRNQRGTFAFAMKGPNTRLTQIYINLGDNSRNDGEPFSILGTVVEGMDVVDRLYSGYGEQSGSGMRQGRQGPIEAGGNAYLDRKFPLLDRIIRACVIAPTPSC